MAVKKGGLGRGLESLFNENAADTGSVVTLKITEIEPNRNQPRRDFDEQALTELADSISKHGLLQPILVRPLPSGAYQIVAGERRWRACRMAELDFVPVVIKEMDDKELAEAALIENLQREDLNAVEEALGYRSLIDSYGLTQEQVSERIGKSRTAITNALRLLKLNDTELDALRKGDITAGHARALLAVEEGSIRSAMLTAAIGGASVRELEKMANLAKKGTAPKKEKEIKDTYYSEVELALKNELHRKVNIKPTGKDKGTITIEFFSRDELADFAKKIVGE